MEIRSKVGAINFIRHMVDSNTCEYNEYIDLGSLCLEMKEYNMAIELLGKYVEGAPVMDAKVLTNIALCSAGLGQVESVIVGLNAALSQDPSYKHAMQSLALSEKSQQTGDHKESTQEWRNLNRKYFSKKKNLSC